MRIVKLLLPILPLALIGVLFSGQSFAAQGSTGTADRIAGALTGGQTIALKGNVRHQALPQNDQGPVDPAMKLGTMTLLTVPTAAQQSAITQLLAQQQDRKSPNYHKWITAEQYADRFGLSQNDMQQITAWLTAQGFSLVQAAHGRNWVSFTGTAAQVESAFGTEIHQYKVNGELHYANATAPKIPAALSGIVAGVRGLDDFHPKPLGVRRTRPNYYSSSQQFDYIAPGDVYTIYDINPLYNAATSINGTGQKLAVMGQIEIFLSDINDFRTGFGLPTLTCTTAGAVPNDIVTACSDPHFSYVPINGGPPVLSVSPTNNLGDLAESDLDIEWSAAVAPGAQVIFVDSDDTFTSFYYAIDNQTTLGESVISLSYGNCEFALNIGEVPTGESVLFETELAKANAEGITFVNSSGDTGAAECDENGQTTTATGLASQGVAVSYPASSQYVTGVGGTAVPLADVVPPSPSYFGTTNGVNGGSALSYVPEQAWNDADEFAAYCQLAEHNTDFCLHGGSTPVSGWVAITSAATAQEDVGISASGGGVSNCAVQNASFTACVSGFPQPSYQALLAVPGQAPGRFSPDVSFLATPNFPGYIFCTQEFVNNTATSTGSSCADGIATAVDTNFSIIGGTSVSAPVFAGVVTLLNQYLAGSPSPGLGNVNPTLYSLARTPANGAFHPVTTGANTVYCEAGQPSVQPAALQCPSTGPSSGILGFQASNSDPTTGYNLVTGLGSIDVNKLAIAWAATRTASSVALTPSSTQAYIGASVTLTATVTPSTATGNVVFNNGTTVLGASAISAGTASLAVTTLPVATNSITAAYSGNDTLANSTSTAATVTITQPYTISANPAGTSVTAGQTSSPITLTVTGTSGFTSPITLSCPGAPTGVTCNFSQNPVTPSTTPVNLTVTLSTPTTMAPGTQNITVSGAGGGATVTSTIALTIAEPFSLSSSPTSTSVSAGQASSPITLTVTGTNGFTSPITLSCSTAPAGVTCNFSQNPVTPSTTPVNLTVTLSTLPNMATGSQSVTVSAVGGGVTLTSTVAVNVTATTQSYALNVTSGATYPVNPGGTATVKITVASSNGFLTGSPAATVVPITYTCTDPAPQSLCTGPAGATSLTSASFTITTTAPTAELRRPFDRGSGIFLAALLPGLLGILFTVGSRKPGSRLRGMRMLGLILALGFSTLWLGSCGGSSSNGGGGNGGTTPGSYTVTISATTGGASPVTSTTTVTLSVQ
jgi:subtilase family serine protease